MRGTRSSSTPRAYSSRTSPRPSRPSPTLAPKLSLVWLGFRALHPVFYIADKPPVRSLCFAVAVLAAFALFLVGGHVL